MEYEFEELEFVEHPLYSTRYYSDDGGDSEESSLDEGEDNDSITTGENDPLDDLEHAHEEFYDRHQNGIRDDLENSINQLNYESNIALHRLRGWRFRWNGQIERILNDYREFLQTNLQVRTANARLRTRLLNHQRVLWSMFPD